MNDAERWEFLETAWGKQIQLTVPVPAQYSLAEVTACVLKCLLEELDAELVEYQLLSDGVRATICLRATASARGNTEAGND